MIRNLGGNIGGIILAVLIAVFVFTTLMSYYYQMESNLRFLFGENKKIVRVFQVIYLFANFLGVMVNGQVIWSMGDTGAGLMKFRKKPLREHRLLQRNTSMLYGRRPVISSFRSIRE